jgi:DNA-binding winged helix-turn-helix (wHTH) protein/TolB-like protein
MNADFEPSSVDLAREPDFALGPLHVRPSLRQVESGGDSETLEPRVMQVLVAIFQRRGEVVSRDELVQRCWGGRVVGEDAISRCIARVRKLGETHGAFTLETIPRVGYRMVSADASAALDAPGGVAAPTAMGRARRISVLAGAMIFAFLAGIGLWTLQGGRRAEPANKVIPRIAVLPFEALEGGAEAAALARAAPSTIADALLNAGHEVVPPSLTQAYVGEKRRDAAKDLKASHVVHGDVALKDGHLLLTARITAADGVAIKSYTFEEQGDAAGLAAQASGAVAYDFRWLTAAPGANASKPAEQAAVLRSADSMSGRGLLAAYEEARRLAEAGQVQPAPITFLMTASAALPEAPAADRPRILAEMRDARRRMDARGAGPSLTHLADSALLPEVDWAGRDAALRGGVDQPPRTGIIAGIYSNFLLLAGRSREAEAFARKHVSMEPSSPFASSYVTMTLLTQGRYDEGRMEAGRLGPLFPDNSTVVQMQFASLVWSGDIAAAEGMLAVPQLRDAIDPPAQVRPAMTSLKALATRKPEEIAALTAACADTSRLSVEGAGICLAGLGELGRRDEAFKMLESLLPDLRGASPEEREAKWLAHPNAIAAYVKVLMNPKTAPLREDPRFAAMVERIGLLDFWRTSGAWPDFCENEPKSVCTQMKAN